jgi:CRP-like cAMP-binding protein
MRGPVCALSKRILMTEKFEAFLQEVVKTSVEESRLMSSLAAPKRVKRRQLLLKEGEICYHKMFIVSGLLKVYRIGDRGTEHILRFVRENEFLTDLESLYYRTPSKFTIEALETSELLVWTREQLESAAASVPTFKAWSQQLLLKNFNAGHERMLNHVHATAEEKYLSFLTNFPDIVRRVPLHMIASYLGVSRETLTRIRHTLVK